MTIFTALDAVVAALAMQVVASGQNHPGALAVDATSVYFTVVDEAGGMALVRAPKAGGPAIRLAHAGANVWDLVTDGERVYWTDLLDGTVHAISREGGMVDTIASGQVGARGLVVAGDDIVWVASFGQVRKVARGGGIADTIAREAGFATSVAVSGESLYWIDAVRGAVLTVPRQGGSPRVLAQVPAGTGDLVIAGEALFFTSPGVSLGRRGTLPASGAVWRVPLLGGPPVALAERQDRPGRSFATDGHWLYWFNAGDGALVRVATSGGAPVVVASGMRGPVSVVVDAGFVYFTDADSGRVLRMAK